MLKTNKNIQNELLLCTMEDLIPEDSIFGKIDKYIDFNFIYDEVKELYSSDNGRPSIDPVVLFKLVFIQTLDGIKSMRKTCEKIKVDETESDLAIIGRYVLNNSIFETIDKQMKKKGKCDFTTAILDTKEIKFAVEISGERFDCGSKIGLIKANIKFRLEK